MWHFMRHSAVFFIFIIIKHRILNLERTDIYNLPPRAW